ncbi:hypothetical protein, partial [Desulfacinum hydrothermale]|uniref:hypothetical protein n=1 Tax=Desulfacinum hydrothermale TaxID=109258 RepID=UPI001BB00631
GGPVGLDQLVVEVGFARLGVFLSRSSDKHSGNKLADINLGVNRAPHFLPLHWVFRLPEPLSKNLVPLI